MIQPGNKQYWLAIGALLIVAMFAFFWQLGERPLLIFDESRQAVNAFEMAQSGNPFITTFEGQTELWSTKPPLFIWLTTLSIKIFGYSEAALRLPSALAGFILVWVVFGFVKKQTGQLLPAFLSALILATLPGFIGEHAARTADFDALLTLFIFLYCASFYKFIHYRLRKQLLLSALFFALAFLTKGIAAGFALPALFAYAVYQKKAFTLLRTPALYAGIALTVLLVGGYYFIREQQTPGYWQVVIQNELSGRFNTELEGNKGPWYFYLTHLGDWRQLTLFFYLLLPLSIVAYIKSPYKSLMVFSSLVLVGVLTVVSTASTKLSHYALPMFPFIAISCGIGLYTCYKLLDKRRILNYIVFIIPVYGLVNASLYLNYFTTLHNTNTVEYGAALKKLHANHPTFTRISTNVSGYNPAMLYYKEAYNKMGYTITNNPKDFTCFVGDTLLTCEADQIKFIEENFTVAPIENTDYCKALVVTGLK